MNSNSPTERSPAAGQLPASAGRKPAGAVFAKLSVAAGVEVVGADLSAAVPDLLRRDIADALEDSHVLVVRGQKRLSDDELLGFASMFGPVEKNFVLNADGTRMNLVHEVHNLDEQGNPSVKPYHNSNFFWHSDKSYRELPTFVTILQPVELPPDGGETQFANLIAAYGALPDSRKAELAGLKVEHSLEHMRTVLDERALTAEEKKNSPPVVHPLVRTHPVTGEKSLYLGMYCARIIGMPEKESRALLDSLEQHATQPQFIYTHQWREGDVIAWDNRWLIHRALPNFAMEKHRRVLRRTVVKGTEVPA